MNKYKIESVMVTTVNLRRQELITKEMMEDYCKGRNDQKDSVNDDLESFFEELRIGKVPDEWVFTYFLPKLTEKELELVERKDPAYFETFRYGFRSMREAYMKPTDSDTKFVQGLCGRKTFTINIPHQTSSNNSTVVPRIRWSFDPNFARDMYPNMNYNMNPDIYPNMNPNLNPDIYPNIYPNMYPNMNHNINPDMYPNTNPNLNPDIHPNINPNIYSNMYPNRNPNMNHNMNPDIYLNMYPNTNPNMYPNMYPNMNHNMNPDIYPNMYLNRNPNISDYPSSSNKKRRRGPTE